MTITDDAALSDLVVSVAEGVSEANRVLNRDPGSNMAISTFDVDTTLWASLSRPRPTGRTETDDYRLRRTEGGTYRLAPPETRVRPARIENWSRPTLTETALLPGTLSEGGRVRIRATIEAVPNVRED